MPRGHLRDTPELRQARQLVLDHGWNATCYQILNPGIQRWFSAQSDAVVGFVRSAGYRIVAGDPICSPERLPEVVEEFETDTHQRGLSSCYFAADERLADLLATRGPLDRILLGAQPVWRPEDWTEILESKASLRAQLNRARNKGVEVRRHYPESTTPPRDLLRCLEDWLDTRGLPPLHFLVEPDTLGRLDDRRVFVAELPEGDGSRSVGRRSVGFLVASPIPKRNGWLIEQNIRGLGAPNGTTELLLDAAVRTLADEGAEYLTLGLCPLSRRADVEAPVQRWWLRALLAWVRAHGRRFYDFNGLDAYKAKFLPQRWEPIYAITSERTIGPRTLWAIAGAFGSMSPLLLVARAVGRAVVQEARWLRRWLRERSQ